jgi:methylthioribose-1-phosphate isomerase
VTPPRWVTSIVTDRGPFPPDQVGDYHAGGAPRRPSVG